MQISRCLPSCSLCKACLTILSNGGLGDKSGEFDELLGKGSVEEVMEIIRPRFNMDGLEPTGHKVGLLDCVHLMACLVDPYNHHWCSNFLLGTNITGLVQEMIDIFVEEDDDGGSTLRDEVKEDVVVSEHVPAQSRTDLE